MNKKQLTWAGIGVTAVVLTAFLIPRSADKVEYLMVSPQRGTFTVAVTATGELQAKNSVNIFGPTGAREARVYEMKILTIVPEGTVVNKGDFVAELDKSELQSRIQDVATDLDKSESQYTQARLDTSLTLNKARDELVNLSYAMEEAQVRRDQSVFEPPSVQRQAEIDYEKAVRAYQQARDAYKTQVQQGRAKVREVEAELTKSRRRFEEFQAVAEQFTITAPENGMVIYKRDRGGQKLTTGGTVNSWNPVVATLPDLSVMNSITYVNEVDIQKVKLGQDVIIGLDADPERKFTGKVADVANIGEQRPNSDAKVFEVVIEVTESDSTLRPSMTTSNTIIVAQVPDAVYIPLECIHPTDSLSYVLVRRGGGVVRQEVRLGLLNENEAIVEAGIDENDRIYLSGMADEDRLPLRRLDPETSVATRQ